MLEPLKKVLLLKTAKSSKFAANFQGINRLDLFS